MMCSRLLELLESVLGKGSKKSKDNYAFYCPWCNHHNKKLEIDLTSQYYHCWTCINTKGRKLSYLFNKLNVGDNKIRQLNILTNEVTYLDTFKKQKSYKVELPPEFIPLWKESKSPDYRNAIYYLIEKRKLSKQDILKYQVGYCEKGKYSSRIIIPSYDEFGILNYFSSRAFYDEFGILNYFSSRAFYDDIIPRYKNPPISKDVIGLDLFVCWDLPIILVEGILDAVSVKRNVIPLFGKVIHDKLKAKIIIKKVKKLYLCLDNDAINESLEYVMYFMNEGIEVYLVNLQEKDSSELGFKKITMLIKETSPMTFSKLIKYKLAK